MAVVVTHIVIAFLWLYTLGAGAAFGRRHALAKTPAERSAAQQQATFGLIAFAIGLALVIFAV